MSKSWIQSFLSNTRAIQRAIWFTLAALGISLVVFGAYYIGDRYTHPQDRSPAELGVEQMEQAIRQEPQNVQVRIALAETYLSTGQYEGALAQAEQVLSLYPENASALLVAGTAAARLERPEAALDPLKRFVALRENEPMANADRALEAAYYFLGESYVKLNRPAEAISVLEAALVINHTDADALYQLGLAHEANDQSQIAVEYYQQAARLVPDFVEVYQEMITSYSALGQAHQVAYARGMKSFCLQDYVAALRDLEQATSALPDFAPAFLGMALTYERLGRLDAALAAAERAYHLDPHDFAAQQAVGRIRAALNSQN